MAGELLKRKREELGLDLKQTAETLRIKEGYLASIEGDLFDRLPVAVYTIGYIRCYAEYLHVDPEPIIAVYTGNLVHPKPSTIFPVASSKKKLPLYYYVIPALVLIFFAVGAVFLLQEKSEFQKTTAAVPAQTVQSAQPLLTEIRQSPPESRTDLTPPQTISSPLGSPAAGLQPSKPIQHSLEIIANDLTWMHITFSNGTFEEILLRPGMIRTWQFTDKAVLKLGNAGGIRLNLDGRDIGSPGSLGQVITLVFPENQKINRQGE